MNKILFIFLFLLLENVFSQHFGGDEGLKKILKICNSARIDYQRTPKTNSLDDFLKLIDYDINEEKNNTLDSNLYKLFTGDDLTLELNPSEKYLFNITEKYIFNKGVLILSIFWNGLIISFILGKCFFSEKNSQSNLFAKKYLNWGQIVFMLIFLLNCIPFFTIRNFGRGFNASSCSLARFLQEVKFGKSTYNEGRKFDRPYRWLGLLNLDNVLLDLQNFFNQTGTNRREVFDDINLIKQHITIFETEIENLENYFSNISVFLYNRKMKPLYVNEFNNITKKGSKINEIYNQYQIPIDNNYRHMLNINKTTTIFESKNLIYKNNIEGVYKTINGFSKFITPKSINITNNIQFLHEKALNRIYQYLKYSYILNMVISAFLSFLMYIYYQRRYYCFKIILHFGWNICMIIILISFVVSYFLFSLGASFYHLIYVLYADIFDVEHNGFFNTCLNQKGNLIHLFEPSQVTSITEFNDFYHLIIRQNKIIQKIKDPKLIEQYLKEINKYKVDISLTTNEQYNFIDINNLLNRLSNITKDKWVSERLGCEDSRYLGKQVMLSLGEDKKLDDNYCLAIQDMYTEDELRAMYKKHDENKLYEICTIVSNLNNYYIRNQEILTILEQYLININKKYYELSKEMNDKIKSISNLVDLYLTLFPYMTEDESLFEIFNCDILKSELNIYIDYNYNYVYFYCRLFGIISLAISILTFIGMILIINSILWIDSEEKEKTRESLMEEELDEIKEEEGEEEEELDEEETEEKNS